MSTLKSTIIGIVLILLAVGGLEVNPLNQETEYNQFIGLRLASQSAGGGILCIITGVLFLVNRKGFAKYLTAWVVVVAGALFWITRFASTGIGVLDAGFSELWRFPHIIGIFTTALIIFGLILVDKFVQKSLNESQDT